MKTKEYGGELKALRDSQLKLAAQIAESLEADIIRRGCPVGLSIGNELALAQQFGVSRWVMREALAITEQDGLTEMKRGRNGGLVVAAGAEAAVAAALCNFLLFTRVDVRELIEVRKIVERVTYVLAARQLNDSQVIAAKEILDHPGSGDLAELANAIYNQTLKIANNSFVSVFASALSKLTGCLVALNEVHEARGDGRPKVAERLLEIRRRQLACVVAADPHGATQASAAAAEAWAEMFAQPPVRRPHSAAARASRIGDIADRILRALHPGREPKLSNLVATRLAIYILREQLQPGDPVAPEPELMELFGVGRHVLREGIRVLERHGFVQTEVGRNGGLRVGAPDARAIVNRTVSYFGLLGVTRLEIEPLTADMLILAAELAALAAGSRSGADLLAVKGWIEKLDGAVSPAEPAWLFGLGRVLSAVSGNAILGIFFSVLAEMHPKDERSSSEDNDCLGISQRMLSAIAVGDVGVARRSMAQLAAEFGMFQP